MALPAALKGGFEIYIEELHTERSQNTRTLAKVGPEISRRLTSYSKMSSRFRLLRGIWNFSGQLCCRNPLKKQTYAQPSHARFQAIDLLD